MFDLCCDIFKMLTVANIMTHQVFVFCLHCVDDICFISESVTVMIEVDHFERHKSPKVLKEPKFGAQP